MDHLTYSQDKSFLFFDVTGSIGKKISYEFYDKTNYIQSVLLNRNEIDSLDVRNSKPHLLGSEIIKHYKNIGYEDVSVNGPIVSEESEKHINYKFEITPGSLYYLNEVVFLDNKYLNHMKLMEALNLSSFWKKALPLNREQFIDGLDNIQALYEKEGFWDIKVETPRESRNEQAITFTLPIKEGKQRLLNSLVLKGLTPDEEVEVRASWFTPTGNPIDKNLILELQKTIQEYLFNKGFLQAKTDVEFKITHHKSQNIYIDVVITAQKNKLAYIRKISISGLVHTSEEVVRRELLCAPDTIYSPKAIHKTRNALLGLGIFSSVQLTTAPAFKNSESFDFVDINIELKESDRTQISFGPGYNLLKGLHYITEFNYNNLSGSARKLNLRASVSQEKNQESIYSTDTPQAKLLLGRKIGLGYQEPYLFGYPLTGQLSLSHKATADNIWKFTNMFEASVRYTLKEPLPHATIVPFYNLRFNNDEGTSAQEDLLVATGNSRIGVIGTKFYWDGRDSLSWPTKGLLLNLEVQVAEFFLGGDINYIKWETNVSVYQKLVEDVIGALNLSVAAYENVQEKNKRFGVLPSTERLQAGGQQRVRGFVQPLGPYVVTPTGEAQTPFGGTHRLILKTELRRPFIDHFLGGSLFLDCGNSYFTQNEIDAFEERLSENTIHSNQMPSIENNQSYSLLYLFAHPSFLYEKNYQSYGTSVNFLTPIGAINFALAWPLHEPFGIDCQSRQGCYKRARQGDIWYKKVKAELNIGSEF